MPATSPDGDKRELRDSWCPGKRAPAGPAQEAGSRTLSATKEAVFSVSLSSCRHTLEQHGLLEAQWVPLVWLSGRRGVKRFRTKPPLEP